MRDSLFIPCIGKHKHYLFYSHNGTCFVSPQEADLCKGASHTRAILRAKSLIIWGINPAQIYHDYTRTHYNSEDQLHIAEIVLEAGMPDCVWRTRETQRLVHPWRGLPLMPPSSLHLHVLPLSAAIPQVIRRAGSQRVDGRRVTISCSIQATFN